MIDDPIGHYSGYNIRVQPTELKEGGWIANFTLIRDEGPETVVTPYYGTRAFPSRDVAKREAFDAAKVEINRLSATQ